MKVKLQDIYKVKFIDAETAFRDFVNNNIYIDGVEIPSLTQYLVKNGNNFIDTNNKQYNKEYVNRFSNNKDAFISTSTSVLTILKLDNVLQRAFSDLEIDLPENKMIDDNTLKNTIKNKLNELITQTSNSISQLDEVKKYNNDQLKAFNEKVNNNLSR